MTTGDVEPTCLTCGPVPGQMQTRQFEETMMNTTNENNEVRLSPQGRPMSRAECLKTDLEILEREMPLVEDEGEYLALIARRRALEDSLEAAIATGRAKGERRQRERKAAEAAAERATQVQNLRERLIDLAAELETAQSSDYRNELNGTIAAVRRRLEQMGVKVESASER